MSAGYHINEKPNCIPREWMERASVHLRLASLFFNHKVLPSGARRINGDHSAPRGSFMLPLPWKDEIIRESEDCVPGSTVWQNPAQVSEISPLTSLLPLIVMILGRKVLNPMFSVLIREPESGPEGRPFRWDGREHCWSREQGRGFYHLSF